MNPEYEPNAMQFLMTPANSNNPLGPTGANQTMSWRFITGLIGVYDIDILSIEYSNKTPTSTVLQLTIAQIPAKLSVQNLGALFVPYYDSSSLGTLYNNSTIYKKNWKQAAVRMNTEINFTINDVLLNAENFSTINYLLVSMEFRRTPPIYLGGANTGLRNN